MNNKINSSDIEKIIPKQHYNVRDISLREKYTEWCLKKYLINNKTYVTISVRHPNTDKVIYIDTNGDQIIYSLDSKYDQYIVENIYWYAS